MPKQTVYGSIRLKIDRFIQKKKKTTPSFSRHTCHQYWRRICTICIVFMFSIYIAYRKHLFTVKIVTKNILTIYSVILTSFVRFSVNVILLMLPRRLLTFAIVDTFCVRYVKIRIFYVITRLWMFVLCIFANIYIYKKMESKEIFVSITTEYYNKCCTLNVLYTFAHRVHSADFLTLNCM